MAFEMVVDRIEEDIVILLVHIKGTEKELKIPKILLPKNVKEGDIIDTSFKVNETARNKVKEQAAKLLEDLLSDQK